jgi:peptidoglycan/xylan/chitin deacetylase (PgdA/CDA1 family)
MATYSRRTFLSKAAMAAAATAAAACSKVRGMPGGSSSPVRRSPAQLPSPPHPGTKGSQSDLTAPGGPAAFVQAGPPTSQAVALTFHGSGDIGLTGALLDAAARASAPLTIFAVGSWLEANPQIAGTILSQGHELANHTFTHPALGSVGRARLRSEIVRCRDVLARQTGSGGRWFRPSGVARPTAAMLEEAGIAGYATIVGYDVDPLDYQDPGAAAVARRVAAGLHAGSIVSLHTGHAGTVEAFPAIVGAVRARGLEPVVVSDLVGVHR